jgi:hypothetical protein
VFLPYKILLTVTETDIWNIPHKNEINEIDVRTFIPCDLRFYRSLLIHMIIQNNTKNLIGIAHTECTLVGFFSYELRVERGGGGRGRGEE